MVVSEGVVSLGSSMCSVVGGRSSVALRVSKEVRRAVLGLVLSPFGNLAMSTFVGGMCRVYCYFVWCCFVMRLFQLFRPSSHRGAKCLSILSEYCMGLHCCWTILSCSFVPIRHSTEVRFAWRVMSTSFDASRMLVVMSLFWWRGGRRSNSSPGMWLASLKMRSVGSLREYDSSASRGQ
jgi:hypothetical protein